MRLTVLDGAGTSQIILTPAQEAVVDHSGAIVATGVAQEALTANSLRAGFLLQNKGSNAMHGNLFGLATTGAGSFKIEAGAFFPPAGYPITTGALSIIGTIGDVYTLIEW